MVNHFSVFIFSEKKDKSMRERSMKKKKHWNSWIIFILTLLLLHLFYWSYTFLSGCFITKLEPPTQSKDLAACFGQCGCGGVTQTDTTLCSTLSFLLHFITNISDRDGGDSWLPWTASVISCSESLRPPCRSLQNKLHNMFTSLSSYVFTAFHFITWHYPTLWNSCIIF